MAIGVEPIGKIPHFAGIAVGQPRSEAVEIGRSDGRRGPGQVEAQPQGLLLQSGGHRMSVHNVAKIYPAHAGCGDRHTACAGYEGLPNRHARRTIMLYTIFRWEIAPMRYWLGLLLLLLLLAGCGPELSKSDLGTVVYELPKVAGADEPYQMPQLGPRRRRTRSIPAARSDDALVNGIHSVHLWQERQ